MSWWVIGAAANTVILAAYLAIAVTIGRGLVGTGQWRTNPLGVATALIFFTCAVHHGSHPAHMLLPYVGLEEATGEPMRAAFDDWHVSTWDIGTAIVGVWYWTLRRRFPVLVRGAALFDDVRERQKQALEINDNVVQGLTVARYSLDRGDTQRASEAVDVALGSSRAIIGELLGERGSEVRLGPGDLRRVEPADVLKR